MVQNLYYKCVYVGIFYECERSMQNNFCVTTTTMNDIAIFWQ